MTAQMPGIVTEAARVRQVSTYSATPMERNHQEEVNRAIAQIEGDHGGHVLGVTYVSYHTSAWGFVDRTLIHYRVRVLKQS